MNMVVTIVGMTKTVADEIMAVFHDWAENGYSDFSPVCFENEGSSSLWNIEFKLAGMSIIDGHSFDGVIFEKNIHYRFEIEKDEFVEIKLS